MVGKNIFNLSVPKSMYGLSAEDYIEFKIQEYEKNKIFGVPMGIDALILDMQKEKYDSRKEVWKHLKQATDEFYNKIADNKKGRQYRKRKIDFGKNQGPQKFSEEFPNRLRIGKRKGVVVIGDWKPNRLKQIYDIDRMIRKEIENMYDDSSSNLQIEGQDVELSNGMGNKYPTPVDKQKDEDVTNIFVPSEPELRDEDWFTREKERGYNSI